MPLPTAPGTVASGRYVLERLLGEGASKRVYLGRDTRLERPVAVALIKADQLDASSLARVRREAQAMARLGDHPHIVTVHDVGEDDGRPYIVSQFMAGGSLEELLGRTPGERLPVRQVVAIGREIAAALDHAHRHDVIHRDVKPSNVWFTDDGVVKLGDFGLAFALDRSRITVGGMMVGTLLYMAPEQALGAHPDARGDLYALGAVLYEMLTGRPPFQGQIAAIVAQLMNAAPEPPSRRTSDVPPALDGLILRLLAKTPAERPSSAAAVHAELTRIVPTLADEPRAGARDAQHGNAALPVTILFTDVVDASGLLARVGDERARAMLQTHHEMLKTCAVAHGGEEVKWLGDGLMAVFSSAANAVQCAVAMQRAVGAHATGERLAIRIGLNVGEAVRDESDYFGTPVMVARRLCDVANAGQILCSYLVTGLLAGRRAFHFRDLGPLALKGIAQPLRACEVSYATPDEARQQDAGADLPDAPRLALPSLLVPTEQFAFVGRQREVETLVAAWHQAASGRRRVVLVHGEPGIGKTRLAAEAARIVHATGGTVFFGRCDEDLAVPFQPFVEVLERFLAATPDAGLGERLGHHAGELVRLHPEIGRRVPGLAPQLASDPETERYRLFDAVAGWLSAAAAGGPLLLVLDDLHWAAKPTLHMLRHVVAACASAPLMIVGTLRDTEVGPTHPLTELLADFRTVAGVERLALEGLDAGAVVEFLEQASGQLLDDAGRTLARVVHADTAGNPFFVGEVLRHLVESQAIVQRGGRWVADVDPSRMGIPAAVREVVVRRVHRLSPVAVDALTVAAVIGRDFEVDTLAAVGSLAEDSLLRALDEAIAARLVDETGVDRYRFTHVLVRSALYDGLTASRRGRYHRRVGEVIEGQDRDDVTSLAHHFAQAGPTQARKAITYTTLAGDRALARLAHEDAVQLYERALALLDESHAGDDAERTELLIRLGTAQKSAGSRAYRETLLAAAASAQRRGDTDRLVRAALTNNRGWASTTAGVDVERVAVLETALAALGEADGAPRAMLLATLAAELLYAGDRSRRLGLSDAALAMARRLDDPVTLAHVLNLRSHVIWAPDTLSERLANTSEHVAVAERLADPVVHWYASATRLQACMEAGDVVEVDRHLAIVSTMAEELGLPHQRWAAVIDRAWRELLRGHVEAAEASATAAYELGAASGQRDALGYYTAQLTAIRKEQGRLGELIDVIEPIVARPRRVPLLRPTLALAYCEVGRPDAAARIVAAAAASRFEDVPIDMTWLTELALYAEAASHVDAAGAALLYERLAPWPGHVVFNGVYAWGSVSHALGLLAATLGRHDDATRHFAVAADTHERIGAPTLLARTRLAWAELLLRRAGAPDTVRARTLLGSVVALARDLGLRALERRAEGMLAA